MILFSVGCVIKLDVKQVYSFPSSHLDSFYSAYQFNAIYLLKLPGLRRDINQIMKEVKLER